MSSQDTQPDVPAGEPGQPQDPDQELGGLTVEDDPEGTVDPSELAGTAGEEDADVS